MGTILSLLPVWSVGEALSASDKKPSEVQTWGQAPVKELLFLFLATGSLLFSGTFVLLECQVVFETSQRTSLRYVPRYLGVTAAVRP